MTQHIRKLKWERVNNSFDLRLINPDSTNVNVFKELLFNVERPKSDYKKDFNKRASKLFKQWFDSHCREPLPESAYALLSNWFLGEGPYQGKSRAMAAETLWEALFCEKPEHRLTNWRISGSKIVPERYKLWWPKQQECQQNETY